MTAKTSMKAKRTQPLGRFALPQSNMHTIGVLTRFREDCHRQLRPFHILSSMLFCLLSITLSFAIAAAIIAATLCAMLCNILYDALIENL